MNLKSVSSSRNGNPCIADQCATGKSRLALDLEETDAVIVSADAMTIIVNQISERQNQLWCKERKYPIFKIILETAMSLTGRFCTSNLADY